jgi:hypothetical protein
MQKLDEISVTDAIIGRKELDVAENVYKNYFRKASGSNIGAQIYGAQTYYKTCQHQQQKVEYVHFFYSISYCSCYSNKMFIV